MRESPTWTKVSLILPPQVAARMRGASAALGEPLAAIATRAFQAELERIEHEHGTIVPRPAGLPRGFERTGSKKEKAA